MGSVTIHFEGICTQVKLGRKEAFHRAVLVHAEEGRTVAGVQIPSHWAFLAVEAPAIVDAQELHALTCLKGKKLGTWQLDGARLRVANAIAGGPTYEASSYEIPSLTELASDFGQLSSDIVTGKDAACHFDLTSGTFRGVKSDGGSWDTFVEVTTTEDTVELTIEEMRGTAAGTLRLRSGATITVSNTGAPARVESDYDFYLHYLTAQVVPSDVKLPPHAHVPRHGEGLGPGCSNSNFP